MSDVKAAVRAVIDAYNRADWNAVRDAMDQSYAHHTGDATLTRDQFLRGAAWLRAGFPDLSLDIADLLADGDRVAVRLIARGTHRGSLFGEAPTSAPVAFGVTWICRFADGILAEDWETMDELDLRRRVGALPVTD